MIVDVHLDHLVEIVSVECFYSQIIFFPTFHNVLFGRNSLPHTQGIGSYASFFFRVECQHNLLLLSSAMGFGMFGF